MMTDKFSRHALLDKTGATASLLCALHCALMPFLFSVLPVIGMGFLASEVFEWILFGTSALLGTFSLCLGFKKHRNRKALLVLSLGLCLLAAGRMTHEHTIDANYGQAILMVLGGLIVSTSHLLNYRLCQNCKRCQGHQHE